MTSVEKTIIEYAKPYGYIYEIKNLVNNKRYIGQTTDKRGFRSGMSLAGIKSKYPRSFYFINSIEKYGIENFKRSIIDSAKDKQELDQKEEYYILKYNTLDRKKGYNLQHGGSYGKHTEETKQKISNLKKEFYKKNPISEEFKQKLSEIRKGKHMGNESSNWKGGDIECKCEVCGKKIKKQRFLIRRNSRNFCSRSCFYKGNIKKFIIKCDWCKKETERIPAIYKKTKNHFCSRKCFSEFRKNKKR